MSTIESTASKASKSLRNTNWPRSSPNHIINLVRAKTAWYGVLIFCLTAIVAVGAHPVFSQTIDLQLSFSSLTFYDANPQSGLDIPAAENPVSALVTYSGPGVVHVFMLAGSDMIGPAGSPPIPADKIYWTASGSGYEAGTLSAIQPVEASSRAVSPGPGDGWQFYLKSGGYDSGTYQLTVTVMAIAQ
jgi:hypothetical protein